MFHLPKGPGVNGACVSSTVLQCRGPEEFVGLESQRIRKCNDVLKRQVALPSFNIADVGRMQLCSVGKVFLRPFLTQPGGSDGLSKSDLDAGLHS